MMRACLRALSMIGVEEGKVALEYWILKKDVTAMAASECFGGNWDDIVAREHVIVQTMRGLQQLDNST